MIDPKRLLDQVLGSGGMGGLGGMGGMGGLGNMASQARDRLNQAGGAQSFGAGAMTGGLLGLLLGSKKVRKMAGGAVGYGGAAILGAMALRAYQNYQQGQQGQGTGQGLRAAPFPIDAALQPDPALLPHAQPAADGSAFELVLVRGMIAAAKADGHVDAEEQRRLFTEVERMGLDADAKAVVFDALSAPVEISRLAGQAASPEQAAELYLASRLAIDPDHPAERAYLDALAAKLKLPTDLRASLDREVVTS